MTRDTQPHDLPRFVGKKAVAESAGISVRTLERRIAGGTFPRPTQLSPNRVGWRVEAVLAALDKTRLELIADAVTNPDDLEPDQVEDAAVDLLIRAIENQTGASVDPAGLHVTYAPPSIPIPEAEFAKALVAEAARLQERFAGFDQARPFMRFCCCQQLAVLLLGSFQGMVYRWRPFPSCGALVGCKRTAVTARRCEAPSGSHP